MKRVTSLPKDFLIEIPLNEEQESILIDQINRFNDLREKELYPVSVELDEKGRVLLKEGTMIHGINRFNVDVVDSISKSGILTGQAIGIPEDCETFYCADFHRVSKDMSMEEYNKGFTYSDGRCPFGNGLRGADSLAFVIELREEASELLKYDCYRSDSKEADVTRGFTNALLSQHDILSSILYGVPSNMFCGIVLGNDLLEKKEIIQLMIKMFPDCYISSIDGVVIYNPSLDVNYHEAVELRASKYVLEFKKKLLEDELSKSQVELQNIKNKNNEIVNAIIMGCPSELAARILIDNQLYQGTLEYVIEDIERKKSTLGKGK